VFAVSLDSGQSYYVLDLLIVELFRDSQSIFDESVRFINFFQDGTHYAKISQDSFDCDDRYLNPFEKGLPRTLNHQKIRLGSNVSCGKKNFDLAVPVPLSSVQKHPQNRFFRQLLVKFKLQNFFHHIFSILAF